MNRVVSLCKVLLAEMFVLFAVGGFAGRVTGAMGTRDCEAVGAPPDAFAYAFLAAGLVTLWWLVARVLWPSVVVDSYLEDASWRADMAPRVIRALRFRTSDLVFGIPEDTQVGYRFPTTHPSYVGVDLVTVGIAGMLLWAASGGADRCLYLPERTRSIVGGSAVLGIAVLRVVGWVVMGRRLGREESAGAWQPVAYLLGFLAFVVALALVLNRVVA